jgi:hypothetical protein
VPVGAALDHRPRADAAGHDCAPCNIEHTRSMSPARKKTINVGTAQNFGLNSACHPTFPDARSIQPASAA